MADETTAPVVEATDAAVNDVTTGAEPGKQTETVRTFTQAELDAIVTERLQRAQRKAEEATTKARTEAERKAQEEQGQFQKLAESLKAELEQERQTRKALEIAGIRRDVAARLNLPAGLVDRLRGDTEDDITADAQALLAVLPKPQAPNINAGDVSSKTQTLPGGMSEAALRDQAVRFGVKFEDFKAAFVNGK